MIRTPQVPTIETPRLIDRALLGVQGGLTDSLAWLNNAFGKCQILKEVKDQRTVSFPAVYTGNKEYLKLFPDGHIGNFSFFVISDESVNYARRDNMSFKAKFGLIVWFDYRTVYPSNWQLTTVDNVKFDVLSALRSMTLPGVQLRFNEVTERARPIYAEFTDTELDNQYLMRPYGGFRVNGEIIFFEKQLC